MAIGDHFIRDASETKRVRTAASVFVVRNPTYGFTVRKLPKGKVLCERVEPRRPLEALAQAATMRPKRNPALEVKVPPGGQLPVRCLQPGQWIRFDATQEAAVRERAARAARR